MASGPGHVERTPLCRLENCRRRGGGFALPNSDPNNSSNNNNNKLQRLLNNNNSSSSSRRKAKEAGVSGDAPFRSATERGEGPSDGASQQHQQHQQHHHHHQQHHQQHHHQQHQQQQPAAAHRAGDSAHTRLRVDFKEQRSLDAVWDSGGVSLLTTDDAALSLGPECLLCASIGLQPLLYCQVCCEAFHPFCLHESQRPPAGALQQQQQQQHQQQQHQQEHSWCCQLCRYCQACGLPGQLLECSTCRASFHTECLGPQHPSKPSRRNVWLCARCVRCKRCGVTTAGEGKADAWSHDFTLCANCSRLFGGGNRCQVCKSSWSEEAAEGKVMECSSCRLWVHSVCAGLDDDMVGLLRGVGTYQCTYCSVGDTADWRIALTSQLQQRLTTVITSLTRSSEPPLPGVPGGQSAAFKAEPADQSGGGGGGASAGDSQSEEGMLGGLEAVQRRVMGGTYSSTCGFVQDVVAAISKPGEARATHLKATFMQLMDQLFPWLDVSNRFPSQVKSPRSEPPSPLYRVPPTTDHLYAQWRSQWGDHPAVEDVATSSSNGCVSPWLSSTPPPSALDCRQCCLCLECGDLQPDEAGRLLYAGQNEWLHVNCALCLCVCL
ncbi:histone-lysine N-methyltransferase 2A-like [Lampetra fluviatilis]